MTDWVLAADIGGTNIRGAAVSSAGDIVSRRQFKTEEVGGAEDAALRISGMLRAVRDETGVEPRATCLGTPGLIDADRGVVVIAPNLPIFRDFPLATTVEASLGSPVYIENDASAAALGEHRYGAGRGYRHLLHATLGTGIGGGLVLDGRLYRGAQGFAGEIGHIVIDTAGPACNCGNNGCLESLVGGIAFAERAQRLLRRGRSDTLAELVAGREPTSRDLFAAATKGCAAARAEIQNGGHLLGTAFGSLANVLNFEIVTLSGGLLAMGELLLRPAREAIRATAYGPAGGIPMVTSSLGENAGLLGAAAVALERAEAFD
ncbi:MAG: ROK family protein [Dehalococcoidia bacterium]